jgi:hypothetical protein
MTMAVERKHEATGATFWKSPAFLLLAAFALMVVLVALPLTVPIGPMYWDVYVYYDGAARIFDGQVPILDFFTPVGPLGYYIFAGWLWLFPEAQPSLIAHYALFVLSAPLMAVVIGQLDARSRATGYAVLIPFLLFSLLPFNGREFYPFPSSDAFGIYNRHICQMLYVLVSALLLVRNQRTLAVLVTVVMTAMFFLKITGFIAGGMICLFAFAAGRYHFRHAVVSAIAFLAILAGLELATGIVSAYIADIDSLVENNSGTLIPRLVQSLSINIDIVATSVALFFILAFARRERLASGFMALVRNPRPKTLFAFLDNDLFWLAAVVAAGAFFEAQNTGSQAFIFVWPVLWMILRKAPAMAATPKLMIATAVLAAAVYLPMVIRTSERAIRTYASAIHTVALPETHNLKALASVTTRDYVLKRAQLMLDIYPKHEAAFEDIAANQELPAPLLYSDLDFQVGHLLSIDKAIDAIHALEAKNHVEFKTIMALNFANPFPYLMDRSAPRLIAIGADPFRAVPKPSQAVLDAVADVDLALYPKCPVTWANVRLMQIYGPGLKNHRRISLDTCFDAYVNPRFDGKIAR